MVVMSVTCLGIGARTLRFVSFHGGREMVGWVIGWMGGRGAQRGTCAVPGELGEMGNVGLGKGTDDGWKGKRRG